MLVQRKIVASCSANILDQHCSICLVPRRLSLKRARKGGREGGNGRDVASPGLCTLPSFSDLEKVLKTKIKSLKMVKGQPPPQALRFLHGRGERETSDW